MTAKELKMRLDRFDEEKVFIRIAAYDDQTDVTILTYADMDGLYIYKEGDHINLDFSGIYKLSRRLF